MTQRQSQESQDLAIELLRETNPAPRGLIGELQTTYTAVSTIDYQAKFPTLARNLDLAADIQKNIQAVNKRYENALTTRKKIENKHRTAQLRPTVRTVLATLTRPIRNNLAMLANIKARYSSPMEVEATLSTSQIILTAKPTRKARPQLQPQPQPTCTPNHALTRHRLCVPPQRASRPLQAHKDE
ncbi:hypothetical protein N7468_008580 [Penicillium chermesinum]|uniref:Uncharacterized protein n=1 Tax=Penicillium chermesinum TaxID=63820 RepID=A0A9W9NQH6_9EURO|nr:uncharacterized protein N7468_008580 [Penicillium chermesinum]KAJ5224038.1 hypothetical protein N7468_008580 [Penicillium chermesinum]